MDDVRSIRTQGVVGVVGVESEVPSSAAKWRCQNPDPPAARSERRPKCTDQSRSQRSPPACRGCVRGSSLHTPKCSAPGRRLIGSSVVGRRATLALPGSSDPASSRRPPLRMINSDRKRPGKLARFGDSNGDRDGSARVDRSGW
ncbi:hypothetical protein B2J93_6214 [Marssonina coronariae]|uniref:Uncharacterized protein n=1 Tax=Diplocarpon coronariae TaxID=2795749 RepID=A0A218ZE76_9HELO|nr:hypothetical protein B2J93_6214 [Marssonina coronariae]